MRNDSTNNKEKHNDDDNTTISTSLGKTTMTITARAVIIELIVSTTATLKTKARCKKKDIKTLTTLRRMPSTTNVQQKYK